MLLDVRMPDIDGFGVLAALGPHSGKFLPVVMTGHGDVATAVQAMKAGALDFLEKPFDDTVLLDVLERLGDRLDSARRRVDEREEALRRIASLSPREVDVLGALTSGAPNKVVADQLSLSVRTVEMHRANLMEKLGVRSFADALRLAFHADLKPQSAD